MSYKKYYERGFVVICMGTFVDSEIGVVAVFFSFSLVIYFGLTRQTFSCLNYYFEFTVKRLIVVSNAISLHYKFLYLKRKLFIYFTDEIVHVL